MLRIEEMNEIGKDNVLLKYDKLCEIMKKEVCRASGKKYKKKEGEEKGQDKDRSGKEVNKEKKDNRKRQQAEW